MKFINELSNGELKEIFRSLTDKDAKIVKVDIVKLDNCIKLNGVIEIPEFDAEILKEKPDATITTDDEYVLTDYDVEAYNCDGDYTPIFRRWMYHKFGVVYATSYLFD